MKYYWYYEFPVGSLGIGEDGEGISNIFIPGTVETGDASRQETPLLMEAARQLEEYFSGYRREFQLPLSLKGTGFRRKVWEKLCEIPYGESRSYSELAAAVGNPRACRAVGMANHDNPVMVVVPCHRVLGKDASLTGYAGGLEMKKALLDLEKIPYRDPAAAYHKERK